MARWALLSAFVSLLAACGVVGNAKADERTAQELADRLFPGQLTVIGSRSLFPQDSGSEVTFSVRDDPTRRSGSRLSRTKRVSSRIFAKR